MSAGIIRENTITQGVLSAVDTDLRHLPDGIPDYWQGEDQLQRMISMKKLHIIHEKST